MNYKRTNEIRKLTGIATIDLVKLCHKGYVNYYIEKKSKHKYRIDFDSLQEYLKTNKVPTGAFRNIAIGTYALLGGYDHPYAVNTETGEVVNFDNGGILKPKPNRREDDGKAYYQVFPMKNGKRQAKLVHRLILESGILPNKRGCDQVHHINGDSSDNRPVNLLPTFGDGEHNKLDYYRKNKSRKDYKKLIAEIRKLNSEETFEIPHPDWQSDECNTYIMVLNKKGYQEYCKSGNIPLDTIRGEIVRQPEKRWFK